MKRIFLSIIILLTANTHFAEEAGSTDKPQDSGIKKESWEKMRKVALVVGVNKYTKPISDLTYADKDSSKIAKALLSVEDYDVILMNDEVGKEKPELLPTFQNVTNKWKEITSSKPGLFLFYFSGHGFQDEKKGNAIALADTRVVPEESKTGDKKEKKIKDVENVLVINDLVDGKYGKADRTVFFIDACREKVSFVEGSKNLTAEKFGKFSDDLWKAKGTWMLLSTAPEELSYEYSNLESGLFTHYLEAALTGGIQNESSEEYVTLASLEKYLTRKMEYFNEAQKGTGFYKDEPQKPFLVGENADLLISTKRPTDSSRVENFSFRDILEYPILAKLVFDQNGRRIAQRFYELEDDKPKDKALDGIGAMEYQYKGDNGEKFVATQIQTNKTKEFVNGLWEEEGKGWEYKAPKKTENSLSREYERRKFDYNGNLILEESFRVNKDSSSGADKKQSGAATLHTTQEGIATKVYAFDINGKETLKEFYDTEGQLKNDKEGIARYVSAYDTKGNLLLKEYYDEAGKLHPNKYGIARISNRFSYKFPDKIGRIMQKEYRNEKAELDGDKDGVAIIRYEYTAKGLLKKQEYLDSSEKPRDAEIWISPEGEIAVIPDGESSDKPIENSVKIKAAKMEREVENELVKSITFYRQNGKLKFFRDGGIARIEYKYDKFGNRTETTYFSEGKTRVADKDGISKTVNSYDENCLEKTSNNLEACVNLKAFYDATDEIVADNFGFGKQEFKYDALGNQIYEAYYDPSGKLKETTKYETPIAIQEREFDPNCLESGQSYLQCYKLLQMKGSDGNLKADKWGIAKYTAEFSANGKVTKREFFDALGKLKNHSEYNYAREIYEYNKEGYLISMSSFTEDGKLVGDTVHYTYTEKGDVKTIDYTGDKNQKLERSGIHQVVYDYQTEKDGVKISKEYRDASGSPVELDGFFKTIEKRMEAKGAYSLEQEYYGKDNKLKSVDEIAKIYRKWNFVNQLLEERKYDTQAGLIKASKWNNQGRLIEQRFEDGKNKLILNPESKYAKMSAVYTEDSILLEQKFFGADDKAVDAGGYATFTARYDDKKRLLLKETLDAKGELVADASGTAKQEYEYKDDKLVYKACYAAKGKLKACELDGIAKYKLERATYLKSDEAEKELGIKLSKKEKIPYTREIFLGEDSKPIQTHYGYATKIMLNDDSLFPDKPTYEIYLDANGKRKESSSGCAILHYLYNAANGDLLTEECKDASGNLAVNLINRAAKMEYSYSEEQEKRFVDIHLTGVDSKPISGISLYKYEFDKSGNKLSESFYEIGKGQSLQPADNSFGIARYLYRYDAKGNLIQESYLGKKGEPVTGTEGIARFDYRYNPNGKKTMVAAFHKSGNILSRKEFFEDGTLKMDSKFDSKGDGNIIERKEFFSADKLLTYEKRNEKGELEKSEYHLYTE